MTAADLGDPPIPPADDEEGRFRLLVDSLADQGLCLLDPNGVVRSWSAAARIAGRSEAKALARHISFLFTTEDRAAGEPDLALQTAARTGAYRSERWLEASDGERFWSHVAIHAAAGGAGGFAVSFDDQSYSRQRAEAGRQAEASFRRLVDGVTDYAIYMLDPEGLISSWNRGARRIKGYEEAEVLGKHFSIFYTEEDRRRRVPSAALAEAERTGRFEAEAWRVRKGGTRFAAHVIIDAIRDERGHLVGFAKVTRDVTERAAAAERLRQTEASFQRLVEGVADYAIFLLDRYGRVATWNSGARRIKGYTTEEAVGLHFSAFYPPEARAEGRPAAALAEAAANGRREERGWRMRKDGSRFWAEVIIDAIHEEGELVGFAKVTRDITERRAAEEALRASYVRVERLTQALNDKEVLLQEVHHRVKNNLQVVCSLLTLQARATADDKAQAALSEAASRIQAMSLIHESLYNYDNASSIDFGDYLAKLAEGIAATQSIAGLEVVVEVLPTDARLDLSVAVPLSLIANELITNAFKHAFQGRRSGRISVAAKRLPGRIELCVADDGRGGALPPIEKAKSVGLQIVRALTRQLGAEFEHSGENGARFVVRAPLPDREDASTAGA